MAFWTLAAVSSHVAAGVLSRGPDATPFDDRMVFGLVPAALLVLAQRARFTTTSMQGALATSEVARAKLVRSNRELGTAGEQTEAALAKLGTIVHNLAEGLVAVSRDGKIELTNPALEALLRQGAIVPGQSVAVLPETIAALISTCRELGEVTSRDFPLGEGIGHGVASPISWNGAVWGVVVMVRDVTLEKEIDRMKNDFISVVSHEMRTPLTSIMGFTKLIGRQLEGHIFPHVPQGHRKVAKAQDRIRTNLRVTREEGDRLSALISDVLDLAKMESGQMDWRFAVQDARALVLRAAEIAGPLVDARGNVELRVPISEEAVAVEGDADRLLQVLINLLSNAAKFTDEGTITASFRRDGEFVEFSVADTGVGIGPGDRETVFDKFHQIGDTLTDRPTGTGLGLPICREIVVQHGGRIWVDSEVDVGSRFAFTIPVTRALD
jgi:signal transduction histidine kinase